MSTSIQQAPAENEASAGPRVTTAAERDYQFAIFERMKRAANDPTYRLALIEAFALTGRALGIPSLIRAIDYLQDHADAGELVSA